MTQFGGSAPQRGSQLATGQRYPGTPGGGPPGGGLVTVAEATQIVDDSNDNTLVEVARRVANDFKSNRTTKTSARRLYTEVRQIEAMWRDSDPERRRLASRRATLLRARIAYQAGRSPTLRPVQGAIDALLDRVVAAQDPEQRRKRFLNLVDFYEALIAFNTAQGGQ